VPKTVCEVVVAILIGDFNVILIALNFVEISVDRRIF
jgi:hypothetical protein